MNQPTKPQNDAPWKRTATVMAAVFMMAAFPISRPTRATTPEQASINDILGNSSELLIRRSGRRESAQIGSVLQGVRDALITVPPNNARALLRFLSDAGEDLNLYVQTNPHPESAIYYFPCQMQGGDYLIGWGLARQESRGCETGMQVMRGRSTSAQTSAMPETYALKQWAQAAARQVFYCSASGVSGNLGFATAMSGDPCEEAVQQCQIIDGAACNPLTTGFWWTSDEQLQARMDCETGQVFFVEGTGATMEAQLEPLIQQQSLGQYCTVQIFRSQDFVIIPAPDEVVTALGDDEILVQVRDTDLGLQVEVLKGAINVRSGSTPEPQLVSQGERYLYSESGGQVSTFDRTAALTSIDMEVLCAFSSYPENNLSVSACREANLLPTDGSTPVPVAFCNLEQASGGSEGDRRTLQMGTSQGEIDLEYEMYGVPDRLQLIYEGQEILDTQFVSGGNRISVPFAGQSGRVDVIVTGNEASTTQWDYTLYCPK